MDEKWLKRIDASIPDSEISALIAKLDSVLELQVGNEIALQLNDKQLAEADKLVEEKGGIPLGWLEAAMPGYKQIVDKQQTALQKAVEGSKDKAAYIRQLKG